MRRSRHGEWQPAADRPDPIELLEQQASTTVAELIPIRYGRMLVSPFTFFRGAACVMASDLAGEPRTGLHAPHCGDAHLSNFGTFAGPDRRLAFGVNDFDEALPGPFEWDVKRLVASFEVAGRDRGFDVEQRESVDLAVARSYREAMRSFAELRALELWYIHIDRDLDKVIKEWPRASAASSSSASSATSRRLEQRTACGLSPNSLGSSTANLGSSTTRR